MSNKQDKERVETIAHLRKMLKPGATVHCVLRHVARSGMSRNIDFYFLKGGEAHYLTGYMARLGIGTRTDNGLRVGGCGMDMGFHCVEHLSSILYGRGKGYKCLGRSKDGRRRCPSNYHANYRDRLNCEGTRVYNPDGPDSGRRCYKPSGWHGEATPADWPTRDIRAEDGGELYSMPLTVVSEEGQPYEVCQKCEGVGTVPNPEGPERFDLKHEDGYALSHRWL